ncbi:type II TA system antitoxin MqsA family protein [Listeria rustica]|uniref:HTH cro/C1-type domain-containing protein n=1 Tax=Listeria rustica TaxID=2713503 RepID=A0A7W1T684_9LIST|nr:type II TA system antitoxin MqsA family protein [Listeria rustica]MBA3926230.1 hypothetical protein [Listeria rustica]
MRKTFCMNCYEETKHDEEFITEIVTVRDLDLEVEHRYLKCSVCEGLVEDPANLDYNYIVDFKAYRAAKGLLQPDEIKMIRDMYSMSQREFADVLGISHATLCRYEGGAIQTDHHNSTFVLATIPKAFHKLVYRKFQATGNAKYEKMLENIASIDGEKISQSDYKPETLELEKVREQILGYTNKTQTISSYVAKLSSGKHVTIHEKRGNSSVSNFKGESPWKI